MKTVEFSAAQAGERLDKALAAADPSRSRARWQTLVRDGHILLNGQRVRPRDPVKAGDIAQITEPEIEPAEAQPEAMDLHILYEDDSLLVLNKPAGLVIHPGPGNRSGTLVNALLAHSGSLSVIAGQERPGIVHRLDKETSGCLVVAKNDQAHLDLSRQFAARNVYKIYLALIRGVPRERAFTSNAPIGRHPVDRKRMASLQSRGREATTEFRLLRAGRDASLLECKLHTGRTHQIRVHLHHLKHPVLGDKLYGPRHAGSFPRQMLHAWKLGFDHPGTKERMRFEAPLPEDFRAAAEEVGINLKIEH